MAIVPASDNIYTGDGTTTQFAIGFHYLKENDVAVSIDEVLTAFTFATPGIVNITPAPANGAVVRVFRNTDATEVPYVFSDGVPFLTRYADFNWQTLLYVFQEAWAEFKNNSSNFLKTLRTSDNLNPITGDRTNKLLGFDADGQPVALLYTPESVPVLDARVTAAEGRLTVVESFIAGIFNLFPRNIASVTDLIAYSPVVGQVVNLLAYTTGNNVGGGQMQAKSGVITPDYAVTFPSGNPALYWQRINIDRLTGPMANFVPTNTAAQNDAAVLRLMAAASQYSTIYIPQGTHLISQTIVTPNAPINIVLDDNATINYSAVGTAGTWDYCALYITGTNSSVRGGTFVGAPAWDGANVAPTYASIIVAADHCYISTRLNNIRKVGVWFKDCSDGHLDNSTIEGNYPSGLWTGVETAHYGALFDPTVSPSRGNFKSTNNTIKSCVQGHLVGNYGTGQFVQGFVSTGNIFEGCWNHGIYSNYTSGATIVGNTFNRCQIMVVAGGPFNNVSSNSGYTDVDSAGDERDIFGISMRDSIGCVCSNNTLKGVNVPSSSIAISWQDFGLSASISNNVCSGNTIVSTAGNCIPIRMLSNTVPIDRNIIANNTVNTLGIASEGAISIYGHSSNANIGNKVTGNTINLRGSGWGVYATNQSNLDVVDNTVVYSYNAGGAVNVNSVTFFNCTRSKSDNNRSVVPATFGTNIGVTGFIELGSASSNMLSNSIADIAGAATYNTYQALANSNLLVNDSGPGAPGQTAALGSQWRRTDGGAGTTLYIKETANTSNVWRGV